MEKKLHALVLGATGATGQELVRQLLSNLNFDRVSIFTRKTFNVEHKKLVKNKIDFSKLTEYKNLVKGDIFFSALGTTLKESGSKKQQYLVDYTYQYEFAKMASENGVTNYSLVSSTGANEKSFFFYPKTKGALEKSVKKLKFNKIQIFQPPMLIRPLELMREGEKVGIKVFKGLNKIGILNSQKTFTCRIFSKKND
jgi:uncharacterized protein YbjT (DUF2867 family)